MKLSFVRSTLFVLFGLFLCLPVAGLASSPPADSIHFCAFDHEQRRRDHPRPAAKRLANLNAGEPRTVRMIYFLPNDRQYRAEVVQRMKDEILRIQTIYAEQMKAHGYGFTTFRVETDPQGEPMVHRVDGRHPESYYADDLGPVFDESEPVVAGDVNIRLIVIDNSTDRILGYGGFGERLGKNSGYASVPGGFSFEAAAHELGHAFGLEHDFRDGAYIMSYGPGSNRLSACSAEFLSVHPYFNPKTPIEDGPRPTVELISPRTYPAGSRNVTVQFQVNDSEGLHQVSLRGLDGLIACRGLDGEKSALLNLTMTVPGELMAYCLFPMLLPTRFLVRQLIRMVI